MLSKNFSDGNLWSNSDLHGTSPAHCLSLPLHVHGGHSLSTGHTFPTILSCFRILLGGTLHPATTTQSWTRKDSPLRALGSTVSGQQSPTPALLGGRRGTEIPLLDSISKIFIFWTPWIKAAPGFRDAGKIHLGESFPILGNFNSK